MPKAQADKRSLHDLNETPSGSKVETNNGMVTNDEENEMPTVEGIMSVPGLEFSDDDYEDMKEYIDISEIAAKLNAQSGNLETIPEGEQRDETGEASDPETKLVKDEWKDNWGIKCGICALVVLNRAAFETHYASLHSSKQLLYQCSYCNKVMDHYSTFRSHRYRHVTEGRYRCTYCNKGFSVRSLLRVHVQSKHAEIKPFICETCGKGFGTKPGLKLHLQKHKMSFIGKQWPCDVCGKILLTGSGLKAHLAVHQQGKRFMCELCGKTFTQKVNMQQHLKGHTGEKPYSCTICGKKFAEKSHLNRHCSFHSEERPYHCDICGKKYKTERCLKVHLMTHKAERPCKCEVCGKGFLSNNKLKQHYNIHTGDRPYCCKFCERTFTNYPNYLKHTRRRHKEEFDKMGGSLASHNAKVKQETDKLNATMAEETLNISVVPSPSLACDMIIPEAAIPANGLEVILSDNDPLASCQTVTDHVDQTLHPQIMMAGPNEIMFAADSGMEIVPLYPGNAMYGYHFSPMQL